MTAIFEQTNIQRTINTTNLDSISDNDDYNDTKITLSIIDINKSIPSCATNKQDTKLLNTHIEHRWRFFNINNKKLIEISIKHPDKPRQYINNSGNWIDNYNLDSKWDVYLTSTKYYYTSK